MYVSKFDTYINVFYLLINSIYQSLLNMKNSLKHLLNSLFILQLVFEITYLFSKTILDSISCLPSLQVVFQNFRHQEHLFLNPTTIWQS